MQHTVHILLFLVAFGFDVRASLFQRGEPPPPPPLSRFNPCYPALLSGKQLKCRYLPRPEAKARGLHQQHVFTVAESTANQRHSRIIPSAIASIKEMNIHLIASLYCSLSTPFFFCRWLIVFSSQSPAEFLPDKIVPSLFTDGLSLSQSCHFRLSQSCHSLSLSCTLIRNTVTLMAVSGQVQDNFLPTIIIIISILEINVNRKSVRYKVSKVNSFYDFVSMSGAFQCLYKFCSQGSRKKKKRLTWRIQVHQQTAAKISGYRLLTACAKGESWPSRLTAAAKWAKRSGGVEGRCTNPPWADWYGSLYVAISRKMYCEQTTMCLSVRVRLQPKLKKKKPDTSWGIWGLKVCVWCTQEVENMFST